MWSLRKIKTVSFNLTISLFLIGNVCQAQEFNLVNQESSLIVYGTSSLHDWHIVAEQQHGKILFKNLGACEIDNLTIEVVAESLKSGKKSMDKNTYKALNTKSYNLILFQLEEVKKLIKKEGGTFIIEVEGDLTVSGIKKKILINFNVEINNGVISLIGKKQIKMTDFEVDPPKALLGTITTGDDITIKFSTIFK